MKTKYVIELDPGSIAQAIKNVEQYKKWITKKTNELAKRLAEYGMLTADVKFTTAMYDGPRNVNVTVHRRKNGYVVKAEGDAVLFIEFGAGFTYSAQMHPEANAYDVPLGPGTYPSDKGHWSDPRGWWLPKAKTGGAGKIHTYGNPAEMPMYEARKAIDQHISEIVREVFASD